MGEDGDKFSDAQVPLGKVVGELFDTSICKSVGEVEALMVFLGAQSGEVLGSGQEFVVLSRLRLVGENGLPSSLSQDGVDDTHLRWPSCLVIGRSIDVGAH